MRQHLFVFVLLVLFSCGNKKSTNDDVVLSLPFTGRYYNWTQFELQQLNFKIGDHKLLIDTTYDLNPREFQPHHIEGLENYPAIENLLKKSSDEHVELSHVVNKGSCNTQLTFYIQRENRTRITFKVAGCDAANTGLLNSVYQELIRLKNKYRANSR